LPRRDARGRRLPRLLRPALQPHGARRAGHAARRRHALRLRRSLPARGVRRMSTDWPALTADLEQLLKLRSIPFGMKLYEDAAEMEAIPRIRRPQHVHTLDQVVGQASRLGWTVGITAEDLVGAQCRAVVGLGSAKTDAWKSGEHMTGVWFSTLEDAAAHQAAMNCVPDGRYQALAVGPLASGKLGDPDIALFYA